MTTSLKSVETAVEQAVQGFIAEVKAEAEKVIGWVDVNIPGAQADIASLAVAAQAGAATLADLAAKDATGAISALAADIETALANYAQVSRLPTATTQALGAVEAAAITTAEQIGQAAISVGLTRVLGALAPAA